MRSKAMKAATGACMPRLMRGRCGASTAQPAASASLLERIRDVVLRLIMLTSVSKAPVQRTGSGSSKASSPRAGGRGWEPAVAVTCRRDDSVPNEAVEDCIEFLKRSSVEGDTAKLSSVTVESVSMAVDVAKLSSVDGDPAKPSSAGPETVTVHRGPTKPSRTVAEAVTVKASVLAGVEVPREASPAVWCREST